MVKFDYTYKGWDKNRPKLIKSTGLGEALKRYEAAKAGIRLELDTYSTAANLFQLVETRRAEAIAACKPIHGDAKAYLRSADHEGELSLLQARYANQMVNCLATARKQVDPLIAQVENRVSVLNKALPQWKEFAKNDAKGGFVDGELAKAVRYMIDSDGQNISKTDELLAVQDFASKAKSMGGKGLGVIADKCVAFVADIKRFNELKHQAEQLIREIKPYDIRPKPKLDH